MWDVFFFLVAFLEAVFGSNFQGEKTTWLVSGRGSILGGWGIDDCKWGP